MATAAQHSAARVRLQRCECGHSRRIAAFSTSLSTATGSSRHRLAAAAKARHRSAFSHLSRRPVIACS
eukprot:5360431-Lingulodinium_polyedra.AAC.1